MRWALLLTFPFLLSCASLLDIKSDEDDACLPASYPDINSVPFGENATRSRLWHGPFNETVSREMDKKNLDIQRLSLEKKGQRLRRKADVLLKSHG